MGLLAEVGDLLFWGMLAASTIGPGSVIVMSKSGAEFDLQLLWAVIVGSIVAYTLQEGAARLFIVSGLNFGSACRFYFGKDGKTPVINYFLAFGIVISNTVITAGQSVGAMAALYILYKNEPAFRILGSIAFGACVLAILFKGNVDKIGKALGIVVLLMVVTFGITAGEIGTAGDLDMASFVQGLLIPALPGGSGDTVLAMIATTCLPANLFLASSLAEGYKVPQMRKGVAFATAMAALISVLIVIVGAPIDINDGEAFQIEDLSAKITESVGRVARDVFCIGLFAASFSSAITIALSAAVAGQTLLSTFTAFNQSTNPSIAEERHRADRSSMVDEETIGFFGYGNGSTDTNTGSVGTPPANEVGDFYLEGGGNDLMMPSSGGSCCGCTCSGWSAKRCCYRLCPCFLPAHAKQHRRNSSMLRNGGFNSGALAAVAIHALDGCVCKCCGSRFAFETPRHATRSEVSVALRGGRSNNQAAGLGEAMLQGAMLQGERTGRVEHGMVDHGMVGGTTSSPMAPGYPAVEGQDGAPAPALRAGGSSKGGGGITARMLGLGKSKGGGGGGMGMEGGGWDSMDVPMSLRGEVGMAAVNVSLGRSNAIRPPSIASRFVNDDLTQVWRWCVEVVCGGGVRRWR
jgi:Mn2+/Fe2+ NRAMP family transporter